MDIAMYSSCKAHGDLPNQDRIFSLLLERFKLMEYYSNVISLRDNNHFLGTIYERPRYSVHNTSIL